MNIGKGSIAYVYLQLPFSHLRDCLYNLKTSIRNDIITYDFKPETVKFLLLKILPQSQFKYY